MGGGGVDKGGRKCGISTRNEEAGPRKVVVVGGGCERRVGGRQWSWEDITGVSRSWKHWLR